jgi:hypothetical protein
VEFKSNPDFEGQMGERVIELTQAAVDETMQVYIDDVDLDVEERLRWELERRGVSITSDEWLADQADLVRAGRPLH